MLSFTISSMPVPASWLSLHSTEVPLTHVRLVARRNQYCGRRLAFWLTPTGVLDNSLSFKTKLRIEASYVRTQGYIWALKAETFFELSGFTVSLSEVSIKTKNSNILPPERVLPLVWSTVLLSVVNGPSVIKAPDSVSKVMFFAGTAKESSGLAGKNRTLSEMSWVEWQIPMVEYGGKVQFPVEQEADTKNEAFGGGSFMP